MNDPIQSVNSPLASSTSTPGKIVKYIVVKAVLLLVMLGIGIYLAVVAINYGGYIDQIYQAQVNEMLMGYFRSTDTSNLTPEEQTQLYDEMEWDLQEAFGLHEPFLLRCARWAYQGATLDWGDSRVITTRSGESKDTREVVFEALSVTVLLAGTANVLVFVLSVVTALYLAKRYGSFWDRLMLTLSPLSTIPNWIYAVLLLVIFAVQLNLLPFGGMFDNFPPATQWGYIPIVLKHMLLPVLAILLSMFFQSVYAWRTYFLIHQGEDYVEMAKAKGLSEGAINTRYILKPVLPFLITNFTFMLIGFWQGVIVLEKVFNWPGIGLLFLRAVGINERSVTIALIVTFAYLLAFSVFLLDFLYALLDPRIRIGGGGQAVKPARVKSLGKPKEKQPVLKPHKPIFAKPEPGQQVLNERRVTEIRKKIPRMRRARAIYPFLQELAHYPLAVLGVMIILLLLGVSVYTVVALPYDEAVYLWRGNRPEGRLLPENARPTWINFFRLKDLPPNIVIGSQDGTAVKEIILPAPKEMGTTLFVPYLVLESHEAEAVDGSGEKTAAPAAQEVTKINLEFNFDYSYGDFPLDLAVDFTSQFAEKRPFVSMLWITPDGRELNLGSFSLKPRQTYVLSLDIPRALLDPKKNQLKFLTGGTGGYPPVDILFANPNIIEPVPLPGKYTLRIDGMVFEADSDLDATMILYGKVYGLAGTDHMRRDLMVALLWGTVIALVFGFLGAIATTLTSMMLAAIGAWFGGWVDNLVQRLADVNMIIPVLPVAIMVYYLYSKSLWVILSVVVLLNVFSSVIKNYRAAFLQMKEAPYIEAAQAYGSSNWRIIFHYLIPRILPMLIPQLIILIPTYVCFEATLAFLNVSEPNIPTWGKVIYDAVEKGAFQGNLYWILEPVGLMVLTGLSFAMVGFALDSIFNPRLKTE
jgi:peptide/nickel transport system permease protein